MNNKQMKGISLIVLILTIVIMIILAAVVILTLNGSGILDNAKDAEKKVSDATLKDAATMAYSEWSTEYHMGKTSKTAEEYISEKLADSEYSESDIRRVSVLNGMITVYKNPIIPEGFTLSIYDGERTIKEGLVIYKTDEATLKTKTQDEAQRTFDQFVWVPVPSMTNFSRTEWENNTPVAGLDTAYTEPSSYYQNIAYRYATEAQEYSEMKTSVEKYGGFYIGRYEAGDGDAKEARITYNTGANTVVLRKGAFVYNYVGWGKDMTDAYSEVADSSGTKKGMGAAYLSKNMYSKNDNYTTHLIYGVQWDATLRWLSDKYDVTDSRSWGNYQSSTGEAATNSGSNNMNYTTGRNEAWKAKNIYDLAGNVWEWTMEAARSNFRVYRGGFYNYNGTWHVAAADRNSPLVDYSWRLAGFRPVLYLK